MQCYTSSKLYQSLVSDYNDQNKQQLFDIFDNMFIEHGFTKNEVNDFLSVGKFKKIRYNDSSCYAGCNIQISADQNLNGTDIAKYVDLIEFFGYMDIMPKFAWFIVNKYIHKKNKYLHLIWQYDSIKNAIDKLCHGYDARKTDKFIKYVSQYVPITTLNFWDEEETDVPKFTDAGLLLVANTLKKYDNGNNKYITDNAISNLTNLTSLSISGNCLTSNCYKNLINLIELKIWCPSVKIKAFSLLNLTQLEILDMPCIDSFDDDCIQHLTKIKKLNISGCTRITDEGLRNMSEIEELTVNKLITDDGIKHMTRLRVLDMRNNLYITGSCFKYLPLLCSLDFTKSYHETIFGAKKQKIPTNENLILIAHQLTSLHMAGCQHITNDILKKMTNLQTLCITDCKQITDEGIENLNKLQKLLAVNVNITPKGIMNMTKLKLLFINT